MKNQLLLLCTHIATEIRPKFDKMYNDFFNIKNTKIRYGTNDEIKNYCYVHNKPILIFILM